MTNSPWNNPQQRHQTTESQPSRYRGALLTIEDAATKADVSLNLLRTFVRAGTLPTYFAGAMVYYHDVLHAALDYEQRLIAAGKQTIRPRGQGGRRPSL